MKRAWEKISSKLVYKNKWIEIFEDRVILPGGQKGIYGYLSKPPAVFIIAQDTHNNIYLLKEYRYVIKKSVYQLPAGVAESTNWIKEAKRELKEETGILAKKGKVLGKFYVSPGHEDTFVIAVLLTNLNTKNLTIKKQENDEMVLKVIKVSNKKLKKYIRLGKIECGPSLATLNLYFQNCVNLTTKNSNIQF